MAEVPRAVGLLVELVAEVTTVYWEEEPERKREVTKVCSRCKVWGAPPISLVNFHIVSPGGMAHLAAEFNEGHTACGHDATGPDWWWGT